MIIYQHLQKINEENIPGSKDWVFSILWNWDSGTGKISRHLRDLPSRPTLEQVFGFIDSLKMHPISTIDMKNAISYAWKKEVKG